MVHVPATLPTGLARAALRLAPRRRFGSRLLSRRRRQVWLRRWQRFLSSRWGGILSATFAVMFLGAVVVRLLEYQDPSAEPSATDFSTLGNALWWSLVTILTIGYGDIAPRTPLGRLAASVVMLTGVIAISTLTGLIASALTEGRLRAARGLEQVKARGHVVVCGTNNHLERILEGLRHIDPAEQHSVVLVNELGEEQVQQLLLKYEDLDVQFVRGDFAQEAVLRRANVQQAHAAIILASSDRHERTADERTLLATLAIKGISPDIRVSVEILDPANERHLRLADADDIVVAGEHTAFLLASAAVAPGLPQAVRDLLTHESGAPIARTSIPREFVGKTFEDLARYVRAEHQAILIGVAGQEQGIPIRTMLSGGSEIDLFIERKFREVGRDLVAESRKQVGYLLNPPDDYEIRPDDMAIVISKTAGAS